jgi:hypothetical protein
MPDWIDAFYADVEGMRLQETLDHFACDGEIVFANNPPEAGHAAITELLTGFWSAITGVRHDWRYRWAVDQGTSVLEARVHYTTHGGTEVVVPCVTIIDRGSSGVITSLRVHLDAVPVFAAIGAESNARRTWRRQLSHDAASGDLRGGWPHVRD